MLVDVKYIITPPTSQTMSDLFGGILDNQTFTNATANLGLRMTASYGNSTIRLVRSSSKTRDTATASESLPTTTADSMQS